VDLWDQLQDRAKTTDTTDNLAGDMSYKEVKGATSAAVGSDDEGSVWDVTINGFQGLRDRAEHLTIEAIKSNFPTSFKHYFTQPQWTTIGDDPDLTLLSVTAELDQPLQVRSNSISQLRVRNSDLIKYSESLSWNYKLSDLDIVCLWMHITF
jgi:hypothetical protein